MRIHSLLLLLVLPALLAAGCGGPLTKAEYEKEVNKIGKQVDKSIDKLGSTSSDKAPTADDMHAVATELADAADDLDGLTPPKEVKGAHDQMISGLRKLSDSFDKLSDELKGAKSDKQRMEKFLTALNDKDAQKGLEELTKAQEQFSAKKYRVFADDSTPAPAPK